MLGPGGYFATKQSGWGNASRAIILSLIVAGKIVLLKKKRPVLQAFQALFSGSAKSFGWTTLPAFTVIHGLIRFGAVKTCFSASANCHLP